MDSRIKEEALRMLSSRLTNIAKELIQSLSEDKEGFRESTHGAAFRKLWKDLGEGFSTRNASGGIAYHGVEEENCNPADFLSPPQEIFLNILYNKLEQLRIKANDEKDAQLKCRINFMLISINYTFGRQNNYKLIKGHALPVCPMSLETISDVPQTLQLISPAKIAAEYDEKGHEIKAARETKVIVCSTGQYIADDAFRAVTTLNEEEFKKNLFSEEDIKRIRLSSDLIYGKKVKLLGLNALEVKIDDLEKIENFYFKMLFVFLFQAIICIPLVLTGIVTPDHFLYPIMDCRPWPWCALFGIELFKQVKNWWTKTNDQFVMPSIEEHPVMTGLAQEDRPEEANTLITKISNLFLPIGDLVNEVNVQTKKKKEEIRANEVEKESKKKSVSSAAVVSLRMSLAQTEDKTSEIVAKSKEKEEPEPTHASAMSLTEDIAMMAQEPSELTLGSYRGRTLSGSS